MASAAVKGSSDIKLVANKALQLADMEDDEELFEINIEAVNSIPPPNYLESYFTATNSTLLANCLLPISDVSNAIPTVSAACSNLLSAERMTNLLMVAESLPAKVIGIPCRLLE